MPSATIGVTPYNGSLAGVDLLAGSQTLVLSSFGAPTSGTLFDSDNSFGNDDDGVTTFNGDPVSYIGSGTAQPGIKVGFITIPTGSPVDLVVFEAGGQTYFHYPEGAPNATSIVAVIIDIDDTPYDGLTPICFCSDSLIATPRGLRAVQDLRPGDDVLDIDGAAVKVVWTGARTVNLAAPMSKTMRRRLAPVRIRAGTFGPGLPFADLILSPQHRVLVSGYPTQLLFGLDAALVPAKSLVGSMATQECDAHTVTYHHLLCERHCIVPSNGLPTETMLLGEVGLRTLTSDDLEEIRLLFPDLLDRVAASPMIPAHALLTIREGRVAAMIAASAR